MEEKIVRQIVLSRYYLLLARGEIRFLNETAGFAAVNLLHEALETFILSVIEYVDASIGPKTKFEGYLDAIDQKISPQKLPKRSLITRFNNARVSAKHHLVLPDRDQINGFYREISEFIDSVSWSIFGKKCQDISLVSLISNDEAQACFRSAQNLFVERDYYECLVNCRKALYLEFEKSSDIRKFSDPAVANDTGLLGPWFGNEAPYHARNPDYINKNVKTIFDYIVLDHSKLNDKLLENGIDPQMYWNVWRLTPRAYQREDGFWAIEEDVSLRMDPQIAENSRYVLDSSVDIILRMQNRRLSVRSAPYGLGLSFLTVKRPGIHVYERASSKAPSVAAPQEIAVFQGSSLVPSLEHEPDRFWTAMHLRKGGPFLAGYVREEDVTPSPHPPEGWPYA